MFLNFLLFVSVKLSKPSRGILYFFTIAKCRESPFCFLKFFWQVEQENSVVRSVDAVSKVKVLILNYIIVSYNNLNINWNTLKIINK